MKNDTDWHVVMFFERGDMSQRELSGCCFPVTKAGRDALVVAPPDICIEKQRYVYLGQQCKGTLGELIGST